MLHPCRVSLLPAFEPLLEVVQMSKAYAYRHIGIGDAL